jgi:hypothetical protein
VDDHHATEGRAVTTTVTTTAATTAATTAGHPPAAPPAAPRGGWFSHPRLRTTPARIRALTAAAVLAVAALFAVTAVAIGNARDGLQVIGHDAGPQVVATGDLYFALSDMDAQVADVLLIGSEPDLGAGRDAALNRYERRRAEANRAVLQAAALAADDVTEQRTVRAVLDGLGRYERLAGQAMLLDEQANHSAGPPPAGVVELYRRATDLMKLDLLPKAYNLTLDSGTLVRHSYEDEHSAVLMGRVWVLLAGLVVVGFLLGLQLYLAARFRRRLNPALVLATLGTVTLVAAGLSLLSTEGAKLETAKKDGFDSVLALSRARAIGNSAYADESRYLLDPGRADTYEQVYLDKSLALLYVPAGSLDTYQTALDGTLSRRAAAPGRVDFLGFYGAAARGVGLPGEQRAVDELLTRYQRFQQSDRRMRELVNEGRRRDAVELRTGGRAGSSAQDFEAYDRALTSLIALHRDAFSGAIRDGDHRLGGWNVALPGAAIAIAALVLAGVRPRLSEFR